MLLRFGARGGRENHDSAYATLLAMRPHGSAVRRAVRGEGANGPTLLAPKYLFESFNSTTITFLKISM